jgi:hypothetical protein
MRPSIPAILFFPALLAVVLLSVALLPAPAHGSARFADAEPVWAVNDSTPIDPPAPGGWNRYQDFIDGYWLRPLDQALALRQGRPAADANCLEEVPASAWFHPRNGREPLDPRILERGDGGAARLEHGAAFHIRAARVDGPEPYLEIATASGRSYLLEFDDPALPEVRTAAAVIAARLLDAAGYHVLPAAIDRVRPEEFLLDADAARIGEFGGQGRLDADDLQRLWSRFAESGEIRVAVSRLPAGTRLGGFRDHGVRGDDPNDRIPHEERRSLRGLGVVAAWLDHTRMRADRTLDIHLDEGRFVRHYLTGLGMALGGRALAPHPFGTEGRESYWQMGTWLTHIPMLGFGREYPASRPEPTIRGIGAIEAHGFDPRAWTPAYRFEPFARMEWADVLWGARLVASFTGDQITGAVAAGELSDPQARAYLAGVLADRRARIAAVWFSTLNAADAFRIEDEGGGRWQLTFDDLSVLYGVAEPEDVFYVMRFELPELGQTLGEQSRGGRRLAFDLSPFLPNAWLHRSDPARYGIAHIQAYDYRGHRREGTTRVHIYFPQSGPPRVVGIERN